MHFSIIDPEDGRWASFLARIDHDVYHKPGYVRHLGRERGMRPCACYGVSESWEFLLPMLLAPLPEALGLDSDSVDALAPDGYPGPLFTGSESELGNALRCLMPFLLESGITTCFIRSNPVIDVAHDPFRDVGDVIERGETIPVYLNAPYEHILADMRQGHRYEIGKIRDRGFSVVVDNWDLLSTFAGFYHGLMNRVEALPSYRFSDAYFEGFRTAVQDSAHLAIAFSAEGTPAAGAIFTLCCGIIQYHLAATDAAFEREPIQKLVIDAVIQWGIENEARVVHLGGGVGAQNDSLLHFKAGFSHSRLAFHTMHLVPDSKVASLARKAWTDLHGTSVPESGFFPIHRAPAPGRN